MKHVELAVAFVAVLLSTTVTLGQTPPPTPPTYDPYSYSYRPAPRCAWWEFWCSESVYRNPNLSPVTKRKLWEQDPMVCHTDECRRLRLAAGVEYMGLDPVPPPRRLVVPPPLYTPARPPVYTPSEPYRFPGVDPNKYVRQVWCSSLSKVTPYTACPDK